ncbi:MAG: hypothetical protein M3P53_07975 [Actinomycetota bacterium]|nr:hypothetical protein [Actinomycetota bacterium]
MAGPVGRIDEIVVDCRDPVQLATFWAALLGVTPHVRHSTWATVRDPEQGLVVAFQEVPEPKTGKNRFHIDVRVAALEEAIAACLNLGATVEGAIIDDADGSFQVMLDPEGHEPGDLIDHAYLPAMEIAARRPMLVVMRRAGSAGVGRVGGTHPVPDRHSGMDQPSKRPRSGTSLIPALRSASKRGCARRAAAPDRRPYATEGATG